MKPWKAAGVTLADWRRSRRAVVGLVADLVWRARGAKNTRTPEREAAMQRLSRIAEGDPESTRYGLDLAHDSADDTQEPRAQWVAGEEHSGEEDEDGRH